MLEALRPDLATLLTVAAPFTLLVDMALTLFGPPQPRRIADFTPETAFWLLLLPALVGAIGQLAVARLIARPGDTPGVALSAAVVALPAYLGALLLSAIPTGIGFLLLIVPGVYVLARLFLAVPVAAVERPGSVAVLRRSWDLTEGQAGAIMVFLMLAVLFMVGAGLIAGGLGAALGSVLTLVGLKGVATFIAALLPALLGTLFSVAIAAAASFLYRRLT